MKTGMLWQHDTPAIEEAASELEPLIEQAAQDYQRYYGVTPSVCYVNPQELGNHRRRLLRLGMELSPSDQLAPGQFWLGE